MKKHYLANGQECFIKEKLSDNKFIVNRIFFEDDIKFSDDLDIVVDAVYKNAPTEVYDAKIVELKNHIDKLQYDIIELLAKKTFLQNQIGKIQLTQLTFSIWQNAKAKLPDHRCVVVVYNKIKGSFICATYCDGYFEYSHNSGTPVCLNPNQYENLFWIELPETPL